MAWLKSWSIEAVQRTIGDYSSGAITAATLKKKWVISLPGRIGGIRVYAGTAGSGTGNNVVDINLNGTTIFTTQASRPSLGPTATGDFTVGNPDGTIQVVPGDVISYDVDSVGSGGGCADFALSIIIVRP